MIPFRAAYENKGEANSTYSNSEGGNFLQLVSEGLET